MNEPKQMTLDNAIKNYCRINCAEEDKSCYDDMPCRDIKLFLGWAKENNWVK